MGLGEKIRQARMDAGISQRELCGNVITRNMLSLIENGAANPSMATLQFLAERLGRPVSYFLEEAAAVSANAACMNTAWQSFEERDYRRTLDTLEGYQEPDSQYDRSYGLLMHLSLLEYASVCLTAGKNVYTRQLLEKAEEWEKKHPWLPELKGRRTRLLGNLESAVPEETLPELDAELMLHARAALRSGNADRAAALLEAVWDRSGAEWNFLRGKAELSRKKYTEAICFLQKTGEAYQAEAAPLLEEAYRETGDYRMAYFYACQQRQKHD